MAQQFQALQEDWWTLINASRTPDEVAAQVEQAADTALKRATEGQPLRMLWEHRR